MVSFVSILIPPVLLGLPSIVIISCAYNKFKRIIVNIKKGAFLALPSVLTNKSAFASHLSEAIAAVNRPVGLGLERHLGFLAAPCAGSGKELSGTLSGCLSHIAAGLAALGLILKASFGIKFLFARGKGELFAAFFTHQCFVLIHGKSSLF
jgi:hypothetical protein